MNSNEQLIHRFYSAFRQLDHGTMNACYSDNPIFNDAVFGILEGEAVRCMWEMLCKNARDFSLEYTDIRLLDDEYATCRWTARYTFSKTGRRVVNNIKAHIRIQDGKIMEHTDEFDIWKWSRQALGLPGMLLGWSGYMKTRIRNNALRNLQKYMEQRQP